MHIRDLKKPNGFRGLPGKSCPRVGRVVAVAVFRKSVSEVLSIGGVLMPAPAPSGP